jgi:NAD(P)-dependent dehydrogenase (short-subunit alcohol dehydrogenase family)
MDLNLEDVPRWSPGRAVASVPLSPGNWPRRAYVLPSRHGGRHRCRRWRRDRSGGRTAPIILLGDVTDAGDVRRIADASLAALQRVDILVNAAGGSRPTTVDAPTRSGRRHWR